MSSITVFGGAGEIGGNKVLVDDGAWSVFLDFGMSFKRHGMFYEDFLQPRSSRGLVDYLELGLLPPLRGLYRTDLDPDGQDLWDRAAARGAVADLPRDRLRGVLLSHAHLDHSADVAFLDAALPVFCTAVTAFLAKGIQDAGQSQASAEVVYLKPRVAYAADKNPIEAALNARRRAAGLGLLKSSTSKEPARMRPFFLFDEPGGAGAESFWAESPDTRPLTAPPWQDAGTVWGETVQAFPVDHSIPGASAFILETEAGPVAYTGDVRLHGRGAPHTRAFAEAAARRDGLTLLCEGTRLGTASGTAATPRAGAPAATEEEVAANCLRAVQQAAGRLVIADFGPRNLERLQNFLHIAEQTGRLLVILDKDAHQLRALAAVGCPDAPAPDDPRLRVFVEPTVSPGTWRRERIWEPLEDRLVTAGDIRRAPGDFLVCFSLYQLNDLVDLRPEGGVYIYSTNEPYSDEQLLDLQRLRNWLDHFRIEFIGDPEAPGQARYHASGHAPEADLRWLVETIRPRRLVPIHTEHPEWFRQFEGALGTTVIEPQVGVPIPLG